MLVLILSPLAALAEGYPVRGRVINRLTRQGVPYAAVVIDGREEKGAAADSLGVFTISGVEPGICRLSVSSLGYISAVTPEYMVSAATPFIEIEMALP